MKRTLLMLLMMLFLSFGAASADVEMSVEYVTPTPAQGVVQSGEFAGMTRADLVALKTRVESAIQELDAQESVNSDDLGIWELTYYVDKFQMPTDNAYIRNTYAITGAFSNTATNNSKLRVRFLIDKDDVTFMLYEYGDNQVKNGSSSYSEDYDVYVLDRFGTQHSFSGYIPTNGDRIVIDDDTYGLYKNPVDFLNILKQGGTVKFYIEESDRRTTKYSFTIDDATGFAAAYEQLMTK